MIKINSIPLRVPITKRKMGSLNLNTFRNYHYQILNKMKKYMHQWVKDNQPKQLKITPPVELTYTIYRSSKRRVDLLNVGSIVDKMVSDAIVLIGILPDDNTDYIKRVTFIDGGVDKQNPRADLIIKTIKDKKMKEQCYTCKKEKNKTCKAEDVKGCFKNGRFTKWEGVPNPVKNKARRK